MLVYRTLSFVEFFVLFMILFSCLERILLRKITVESGLILTDCVCAGFLVYFEENFKKNVMTLVLSLWNLWKFSNPAFHSKFTHAQKLFFKSGKILQKLHENNLLLKKFPPKKKSLETLRMKYFIFYLMKIDGVRWKGASGN